MPSRRIYHQELVDWVKGSYGYGKQFASAHQLSMKATNNPNTVMRLEMIGNATPEVLVALARTVGDNPLSILLTSGLLNEEDLAETPQVECQPLTQAEAEIVRGFRELPAEAKGWVLGGLRGMLEA